MDARLVSFGQLEIDGRRFEHDIVLEGGRGSPAQEGAVAGVSGPVWPHAAFGRRGYPVDGAAADRRHRRRRTVADHARALSRGKTTWCRAHRPSNGRGMRAARGGRPSRGRGDSARDVLTAAANGETETGRSRCDRLGPSPLEGDPQIATAGVPRARLSRLPRTSRGLFQVSDDVATAERRCHEVHEHGARLI